MSQIVVCFVLIEYLIAKASHLHAKLEKLHVMILLKKLFLDLGAHEGQSLNAFIHWKGMGALDYDIYSFEANIEALPALWRVRQHYTAQGFNINVIPAVVGAKGKLVSFDGWQLSEFGTDQPITRRICPVYDLVSWLQEIKSDYDEIIVKMDIEGAEYYLIEELSRARLLQSFTDLFIELHGPKRGFSIAETQKVINTLYSHGITPCMWEAQKGKTRFDLNTTRAVIIPENLVKANATPFYDHHYVIVHT